MNQRLDQLEIKIAYLEQANAELSDELFKLRQETAAVREQLSVLTGKLEAAQSQPTQYTAEEEKPPHY
jgi:SlyX protein